MKASFAPLEKALSSPLHFDSLRRVKTSDLSPDLLRSVFVALYLLFGEIVFAPQTPCLNKWIRCLHPEISAKHTYANGTRGTCQNTENGRRIATYLFFALTCDDKNTSLFKEWVSGSVTARFCELRSSLLCRDCSPEPLPLRQLCLRF